MATASHDLPSDLSSQYGNYSQQYFERLIGVEQPILCAPTSFHRLATRMGYEIPLQDYANKIRTELDDGAYADGWNRSRLSKTIREEWGVSNVGCWTKSLGRPISEDAIAGMQRAGYISESPIEIAFLKDVMTNVSEGSEGVIDLVKMGIPVVTTVEPGFATNRAKHAVVLEGYDEETDRINVFDPDERNDVSEYPLDWIRMNISPDGGTTVILPTLRPGEQYQ